MSGNNKHPLVPRLRFPEFYNRWKQLSVNDIALSESSIWSQSKLGFQYDGYVYGASGFIGYIGKFDQKDSYIAIIKDGSGVGELFYYAGESSVISTLSYIKSKELAKYDQKWIFYSLQNIDLQKYIKGSGIPHIYFSDYAKSNVFIPAFKEQQKIADCLSSLDDLITAQHQKIDILKRHKKGLMQ